MRAINRFTLLKMKFIFREKMIYLFFAEHTARQVCDPVFQFVVEDQQWEEIENKLTSDDFDSIPTEIEVQSQVLKSGSSYATELEIITV